MIYYGTEVGMWGADDPEDRMPTWWHRMDDEIFNTYQSVLSLRNEYPALRRGTFEVIRTDDEAQVLAFTRQLDDEKLVVVLNRGEDDYAWSGPELNGLQLLYATDPSATTRKIPRLSGVVFGNTVKSEQSPSGSVGGVVKTGIQGSALETGAD